VVGDPENRCVFGERVIGQGGEVDEGDGYVRLHCSPERLGRFVRSFSAGVQVKGSG